MNAKWNPSTWDPSLTIIDLLEKNKKFGGAKLGSVDDAVRYITRTTDMNLWGGADIEALSKYVGRDGAAWVDSVNFLTTKFPAMITELELAACPHPRASKSPFGLLVLSTGTTSLPKSEQMERLKGAGKLALKYLGVERNRAFLAIHDDTKHLHMHIIYCRFDSDGRLREREPGKFRRYLLEDLTARVAFDLGYRLEYGADTRPNEKGELVDRVSGSVVRDAAFEPLLEGCKERNRKRQMLGTNHKLELVAMAAYWQSAGDLAQFRRLLAVDGIGYITSGSGAVFVDADKTHHRAYDVNRRLTRGKIFGETFKAGLPPEPPAIELRRKKRAAALASAFASQDGEDAPNYAAVPSLTLEQQQEANRRLQRGYSDKRPGAPRKVDLGEWPNGFPWGGIRAQTAAADAFADLGITPKDRIHHVELWRDDRLIAVQRSDQIVVYTRDKEDLRLLLIAAHKQWGRVQLTGNSKFKARMADLAAELDIPVSNPELTLRIERRRSELVRAREREAAVLARLEADRSAPRSDLAEGNDNKLIPCSSTPAQSKLDSEAISPVEAQQKNKADPINPQEHATRTSPSKLDSTGATTSPTSLRQVDEVDQNQKHPPASHRSASGVKNVAMIDGHSPPGDPPREDSRWGAKPLDNAKENIPGTSRNDIVDDQQSPIVPDRSAQGREAINGPAPVRPSLNPPHFSPPPETQPSGHSTGGAPSGAADVPSSPKSAAIEKAIPPARQSTETFVMSAISQVDRTRAPLVAKIESGDRVVLLAPAQAKHFRLSEDDQRHPAFQRQLQLLYDRQEQEQGQILDAIFARQATIVQSKDPYRKIITYEVVVFHADHIAKLWRLHQMNTYFQKKLEDRWKSRKELEGDENQARAVLPRTPDQMDEASDATAAPGKNAPSVEAVKAVPLADSKILARLLAEGPVEQLIPDHNAIAHPAATTTQNAKIPIDPASEHNVVPPVAARDHRSSSSLTNDAENTAAVPGRVSEPVSLLMEKAPKAERRSDEIQKISADPEIERLVSSFMNAKNAGELRKAVVAIRAAPAAKDYMNALKDKRWMTENLNIEKEQRAMHQTIGSWNR